MPRDDRKPIVTYKQLLQLAHERGIQSMRTEIVQLPTEANCRVAVARATLTMADGTLWEATADAAPNNVTPAMLNCLPRMAETRAKARALRDAVNIGDAAFEEYGPGGMDGEVPVRTRPSPRPAPATDGPITPAQITAITSMCHKANLDPPSMEGWDNQKACDYIKSANTSRRN